MSNPKHYSDPLTAAEKNYFKQFCFLLEHKELEYMENDQTKKAESFESISSALSYIESRSFLSSDYFSDAIDFIAGKGKQRRQESIQLP